MTQQETQKETVESYSSKIDSRPELTDMGVSISIHDPKNAVLKIWNSGDAKNEYFVLSLGNGGYSRVEIYLTRESITALKELIPKGI